MDTETADNNIVLMETEAAIIEFPEYVLFGDELIKFDESMARSGDELCPECRELGYCKLGNFKTSG